MLAGCGANEAGTASVESTQESAAAAASSSAESSAETSEENAAGSESTESKAEAIGAGPDYVVAAHKDSVYYWNDGDEMELAQHAAASELIILSPGYEKLKEVIAKHNTEALEGMQSAIASANDFLDEEQDLSYAYFPWESETHTNVTRSDAQLFSFVENYYDYMGGAHGFYYGRGFNFEPETGKELKLTDLVTDIPKLHELVVAQIKDEWDTDELFEEWEDTVAAEFEDPDSLNYLAGSDTLNIWFDTYDLAPYVCGEIQTIIAMEDCEGLFNEAYFHPENAEVLPGKAAQGTDMFQNVIETLAIRRGEMKYDEVKALLDGAGYTYEEEAPGAESGGTFTLTDPENGAAVFIFFWPVDVESDEDYYNTDKYYIDSMRYEIDEKKNGWIGAEYYETTTEYVVIDDFYDVRYFETVEEMARYLFY